MVPKGHWTQKNIDNHWRNYQKRDENLVGEPELEVASDSIEEELSTSVLEASIYELANLQNFYASNKHDRLSKLQKEKMTRLLQKHNALFQGKRRKWKGGGVEIRLKPSAKPCVARTYQIPLHQQSEFKKELDRK